MVRDGVEVYDGELASLKRFKDDVREVREGFECGIGVENFNDLKVGDVIEAYRIEEVARTLAPTPPACAGRRRADGIPSTRSRGEAIRKEVATFLDGRRKDPRIVGFVTVTGVEVTRDLRHARCSSASSARRRRAARRSRDSRASRGPRSRLRALRLRFAPEHHFRHDESVERAARIETLLAQVKQRPSTKRRTTRARADNRRRRLTGCCWSTSRRA